MAYKSDIIKTLKKSIYTQKYESLMSLRTTKTEINLCLIIMF